MSIYKGSGVAIVTPMKANEEVNYDKLEELIEEQISEGTDCIVIAVSVELEPVPATTGTLCFANSTAAQITL